MKKFNTKFGANRSGQLLIVAALAIAILISSTTIYVYELSKSPISPETQEVSSFIIASKQCLKNAVISSLANISNGGVKTILTENLDKLSLVFRNLTFPALCNLNYTPLNDLNYDNGVWLSWDDGGFGVSSAHVNFTLNVRGLSENVTVEYAVNITTTLIVSGYYTLVGDEKQVNLSCKLYNEGQPALTKNLTAFYLDVDGWRIVDESNSLSVGDYGNGTYSISFVVNIPSQNVEVSAHFYDMRDIFVRANTTCPEA